jgi:group I intron endonuclease
MAYSIYKIVNTINNKIYIGKTNNPNRRWKDHTRLAITPGHKEYYKPLYRAMRKYGVNAFVFNIIESNLSKKESGIREKYWIQYYDSYNNGYNASLGGDGGSPKGHCKHQNNGRARVTEEDVIKIRTKFSEGISKRECYKLVQDKITYNGFTGIWAGRTWADIMPEVYTQENINRNAKLGYSVFQTERRLLDNNEILTIRQRKANRESRLQVYQDYQKKISLPTFDDIWHNRTYKEVKI